MILIVKLQFKINKLKRQYLRFTTKPWKEEQGEKFHERVTARLKRTLTNFLNQSGTIQDMHFQFNFQF